MSLSSTVGRPVVVRPRHAASLILVREGAGGPEVLMGRRPPRSAFAPDVFVFPGGRVEPGDRAVQPLAPLSEACARRTAAPPGLARALAAAAVRETAEETGLLLGEPGRPDFSTLTLVARAITPTDSPIRFHARFFRADAAAARGEMADTGELADLAFRPIEEALKLPIMDVTEAVLRAVADRRPPFLFVYRRGGPAPRPLA